jgi:hypothetical protein
VSSEIIYTNVVGSTVSVGLSDIRSEEIKNRSKQGIIGDRKPGWYHRVTGTDTLASVPSEGLRDFPGDVKKPFHLDRERRQTFSSMYPAQTEIPNWLKESLYRIAEIETLGHDWIHTEVLRPIRNCVNLRVACCLN